MNVAFDSRFFAYRDDMQNALVAEDKKEILKKMIRLARRPIEFGIILSLSLGVAGCRRLRKRCMKAIVRLGWSIDHVELRALNCLFDIMQSHCGSFATSVIYDDRLWYSHLRNRDSSNLGYAVMAFVRKLKTADEINYVQFCEGFLRFVSKEKLADMNFTDR